MNRLKGNLLLLIGAFIWGTAFVAQSVGLKSVAPFTFNGVRMFIGTLSLTPVILVTRAVEKKKERSVKTNPKTLLAAALCCGFFLFAASTMQQLGLLYTTPGKSGFITSMYVIMVPIAGIFLRKRVRIFTWISVVLAIVGLYFLCVTENFSVGIGDLYTLGCAVLFTFHILVVDHFSPKVDGVLLSCLQFLVTGLFSLIPMLIFEGISTLAGLQGAAIPLLYAGILSCGVAYTFQIIGQKYTDPTVASILMCLESVFAVLAGMAVLGQIPSLNEAVGCVLMFAAIILSQLPDKKPKKA